MSIETERMKADVIRLRDAASQAQRMTATLERINDATLREQTLEVANGFAQGLTAQAEEMVNAIKKERMDINKRLDEADRLKALRFTEEQQRQEAYANAEKVES